MMKTDLTISIFEAVGSSTCVASSDGEKVYARLSKALQQDKSVKLSFDNVTDLTSAFLNVAIGQLYGKFNEDKIRQSLQVEGMEQYDMVLLKRVVENAKLYFKNPERYKQAMKEAMED